MEIGRVPHVPRHRAAGDDHHDVRGDFGRRETDEGDGVEGSDVVFGLDRARAVFWDGVGGEFYYRICICCFWEVLGTNNWWDSRIFTIMMSGFILGGNSTILGSCVRSACVWLLSTGLLSI